MKPVQMPAARLSYANWKQRHMLATTRLLMCAAVRIAIKSLSWKSDFALEFEMYLYIHAVYIAIHKSILFCVFVP